MPTNPADARPVLRALIEKLETYYDFACSGGPLKLCVDWERLKAVLPLLDQEPVELDYVQLLKSAHRIVNESVLYKKWLNGTPLENDVAIWMTDFAVAAVREHGKHVAEFLNELYAVMVDPCAEGTIQVADMKAALLAAAIRHREAEATLATLQQENNDLRIKVADLEDLSRALLDKIAEYQDLKAQLATLHAEQAQLVQELRAEKMYWRAEARSEEAEALDVLAACAPHQEEQ